MAPKLGPEAVMTIRELLRRGWSRCAVALALSVSEGAVRYHERRGKLEAVDGRARQAQRAEVCREAIEQWLTAAGDRPGWNLAALHEHLVAEHAYPGSLRSIERYVARHYPPPPRRARRRVETPPGGQAQADWAVYPEVIVGGRTEALYAFYLQLSHSRHNAVVWSRRKDQLSWHEVHNRALERLGGVPATIRVDNEKTAMSRGAGAWGEINPAYRRYAQAARFHVDACAPRSPEAKGKIERRIGVERRALGFAVTGRAWDSLEELQAATDEAVRHSAEHRRCPATGTSVLDAWEREKPLLGPLPALPEPFDVVVERRVAIDCTVAFEGRTYSVPFAWVGRSVELWGGASEVLILAGGAVVARHPRGTESRIVLDPRHFEGKATDGVLPPLPLGRMGRRLEEIAALVPQQRPLDLYAALAEVAR